MGENFINPLEKFPSRNVASQLHPGISWMWVHRGYWQPVQPKSTWLQAHTPQIPYADAFFPVFMRTGRHRLYIILTAIAGIAKLYMATGPRTPDTRWTFTVWIHSPCLHVHWHAHRHAHRHAHGINCTHWLDWTCDKHTWKSTLPCKDVRTEHTSNDVAKVGYVVDIG